MTKGAKSSNLTVLCLLCNKTTLDSIFPMVSVSLLSHKTIYFTLFYTVSYFTFTNPFWWYKRYILLYSKKMGDVYGLFNVTVLFYYLDIN